MTAALLAGGITCVVGPNGAGKSTLLAARYLGGHPGNAS
jgi:ABC-type cobalamin/Fe3+-siderophores transport system ATPase subunit